MKKVSAIMLAMLLPVALAAEVVTVDVFEWADAGTGTTASGWEVSGIDRYKVSPQAVRFDTKDDFVLSPVYRGSITQLVMKVSASSAATQRFLTAIPVQCLSGAGNLVAAATGAYTEQKLSWPLAAGVRQFKLQNATGSGNVGWGILELEIHLSDIDYPKNAGETERFADAVRVGWESDARTASNEVEVAKVEVAPAQYQTVEEWDFSSLTNASGISIRIDASSLPGALSGVEGENLNIQPESGGYLQAGNTIGNGKLWFELQSSGERTALLRLYRHPGTGTDGAITVTAIAADGSTNAVSKPRLTTVPQVFEHPLTAADKTLLAESGSKDRRIRVEKVTIASGYVPPCTTTNAVRSVFTVRGETVVAGDADGETWLWRVRSHGIDGACSAWTEYRPLTVDASAPRYRAPGMLLRLK